MVVKRPMVEFLTQLLLAIRCSRRERLGAEILVLPQQAMMDRNNVTRTGARIPGVERHIRSNGSVVLSHEPRLRARSIQATGDTKDGCKPTDAIQGAREGPV